MSKAKNKPKPKAKPARKPAAKKAARRPTPRPVKELGPLMADVAGLELTDEDRELLRDPRVGGVILFTRNYHNNEQLRALTRELQSLREGRAPRLLVAVDHEGGRVQRFRDGFTRIPAMGWIGQLYAGEKDKGLGWARAQAQILGNELAAHGIDLCFAPVLDLDHGVSAVIGDRAFAREPAAVIALAKAFCAGLTSAGMAATGKHFPGHGAVAADSHHELPVDARSLKEIERTDLKPFAALIKAGVPSVMMAHVRYTALDDTPASLSRKWIQGVLRKRLGFKGAVFCDDLSMGGAAVIGSYAERAELALKAGCDMLPVCNNRPALVELMDAMNKLRPDPAASRRLMRLYRANR
ncbi:MAG TPA: beta-N-acetylhexosaminidase [Verrucomicrobiae bacterium]|nr:beta-N-acetylhexosaminidase [Verrucomicrobiae bacterium]